MNILSKNFIEIKGGLSNKKIYRKFEKKINKIVIDFSKDKNEYDNFFCVYDILKKINISIPKIYEVYSKKKIVIMEDFGNNTFNKMYQSKDLYILLKLAVDNLIIIQNSIFREDIVKLKKHTFQQFEKEISEFINYYIPFIELTNFSEKHFYLAWEKSYNKHIIDFSSFTHKDYEFINLIYLDTNKSHLKCGIIDFQSAFSGFPGWDLFSILENPRINFTRKYNEDLIKYFFENINIDSDYKTFRSQYYLLNLGRLTRLLGRWVKLFNKGKKEYLKYIEPTKNRISSCLLNIEDIELKRIYKKILIK